MAQLEHIEAIEKRLWNAAETLWANSNYTSNEYFKDTLNCTGIVLTCEISRREVNSTCIATLCLMSEA